MHILIPFYRQNRSNTYHVGIMMVGRQFPPIDTKNRPNLANSQWQKECVQWTSHLENLVDREVMRLVGQIYNVSTTISVWVLHCVALSSSSSYNVSNHWVWRIYIYYISNRWTTRFGGKPLCGFMTINIMRTYSYIYITEYIFIFKSSVIQAEISIMPQHISATLMLHISRVMK